MKAIFLENVCITRTPLENGRCTELSAPARGRSGGTVGAKSARALPHPSCRAERIMRCRVMRFRMSYRTARMSAFLVALVLASSVAAAPLRSDPADESSITQAAIIRLVSQPGAIEPTLQAHVQEFYGITGFEPAWSGSDEVAARAKAVRRALGRADVHGLRPDDYTFPLMSWADNPAPGQDAAEYDVAMTAALFRYALDVRLGRVKPKDVYKDASLPAQHFKVGRALAATLSDSSIDAFLADLPPPHPAYHRLVETLARYRAIAARGGWPTVTRGDNVALHIRLALEDPLMAQVSNSLSPQLREPIIRFQNRNGIHTSGKLDSETLDALNLSVSHRIEQIIVNMERWRWLPREFESRYIAVNVAEQSLDYLRNGHSELHSKVVIGRKDSPTPIVRAEVEAVVANPPWDIPIDIAAKQFLPRLKENANYLASRNMILTDAPGGDPHGATVEWRKLEPSIFDYRIQQRPGPGNVLGKVMLDAPNTFGVYLHDTPNKELFLLHTREKSNGCVRVERSLQLAQLAMEDEAFGEDSLSQALESGETTRLPLSQPLLVYLLYWTVVASSDGTTEFRPDRYSRDAALIAKLAELRTADMDIARAGALQAAN
ncbi:MAG: L,D-transpeptidase family protein [Alphaproteobacteria bacterium]